MRRILSLLVSLFLVAGFVATASGTAVAAPPTSPWRATAGGDVAEVSLSAVALDLAGARLAVSSSDSGSQLTPRSRSRSSNLGASVVGVPIGVVSNTVDAPPGGGPDNGDLLGINLLGAVALDTMTTRNEAHWSGDTACVNGNLLADSRVSTAGLDVGVPVVLPDILSTGVSSTTGRTELITGTGDFNRSVRSTATGQVAGVDILGVIGVTIGGTPTLTATSDGTSAGSSATYTSGLITVTRPNGTTLNLAPGASTTINVIGVASVVIRAGAMTSSVSAGGAVTASVSVLTIEINALAGVDATVALLPLRANASAPSGGIDCPVPAPVITEPDNGDVTNDTTPTISGTGEPGATIDLTIDGTVVPGAATVAGNGSWSYTPATPLGQGAHSVSAIQSVDGNDSPASNVVNFSIDSTPPGVPVVQTPADGSTITDSTPAITGTADPGSQVRVSIDGTLAGTTTAGPGGTWTFTVPDPLDDGVHTVNAIARDDAGNDSAVSNTNSFTLDATAPAAPVVSNPANNAVLNASPASITGTAEPNSTVAVSIDGVPAGTVTATAGGTWTLPVATPLPEGNHTVNATATDAAGNTSPTSATNTFTIDTTPPGAPVVITPANGSTTNDATPEITGTAEAGASVEVFVDGASVGTTTAAGDGSWSFTPTTPLTNGAHSAYAIATDAAGHVSPQSNTNTFTVDTNAPNAPVVTAPANNAVLSVSPTAVTGTAEPNSTVEVFIDGAPAGTTTAGGYGTWTLPLDLVLPDGPHTVNATATDAARDRRGREHLPGLGHQHLRRRHHRTRGADGDHPRGRDHRRRQHP